MLVLQLLPTLCYGDAVGNDTLVLDQVIKKMGYKTCIYAENIDSRISKGIAKEYKHMPKLSEDDIVIYHLAIGSNLAYVFGRLNCKKVVIYHNITPPDFFRKYNTDATAVTESGLSTAKWLADKVDYCMADSEFNKKDLIDMGYKCPIDVLPILIPFEDYNKEPDRETVERYSDGCTNILFTGRIAPNKCQEDVIESFAFYHKYYNPNSRLILVGSDTNFENYRVRLQKYVDLLDVDSVIFTGHIKFNQILAFYRVADLFLCQSEHEGFCVPLVEAMHFDVPILAYNSTAIGETMGGGGVLLDNKNPAETAGMMDYIIKNEALRKKISANQKKRLADFSYDAIENRFKQLISRFL